MDKGIAALPWLSLAGLAMEQARAQLQSGFRAKFVRDSCAENLQTPYQDLLRGFFEYCESVGVDPAQGEKLLPKNLALVTLKHADQLIELDQRLADFADLIRQIVNLRRSIQAVRMRY